MPRSKRPLTRLLLGYELAFLAIITVTALVGATWMLFWQRGTQQSLQIDQLLYDAQQLRADLYRQIREVYVASRAADPRALDMYWSHIYDIDRRFYQLQQDAGDDGESRAVEEMRNAYVMLQAQLNRVLSQSVTEPHRERIIQPAYEFWLQGAFEAALTRLTNRVAARRTQLEQHLTRLRRAALWLLPVPVILALALLIHSHRLLRGDYARPMASLKAGAQQISAGNLDHRVTEQGAEEVAALARTINHMAADLATSRDALVEKERQAALGTLIPVVAHNIRNPLAGIRASAQILDPSASAEEVNATRVGIIDAVDRLERWVSSLLSYLHPLHPRHAPVSLNAVVSGALAPLRNKASEKGIVIARSETADDIAIIDADLCEQAIHGLLLNALEAAPRHSTVDVDTQAGPSAVQLVIDDAGPGMAFDPHPGDLSPGRTTKPSGTGLGIPFAYKVCIAHGGRLEFEPSPSGGTRVRMSLPREPAGG